MPIIQPTVGRIVWWRSSADPGDQPEAAIITYVWSDGMVNLCVFSADGVPRPVLAAMLKQEGDSPLSHYAEWMPYQREQAAKPAPAMPGIPEGSFVTANLMAHTPASQPSPLLASERAAAAVAKSPSTRVSLKDIEANIAAEYYISAADAVGPAPAVPGLEVMPILGVLTICLLVLRNGFTIIGKSAPADAANFDANLGRNLAREDAIRQAWPLMGYALRDKLAGR